MSAMEYGSTQALREGGGVDGAEARARDPRTPVAEIRVDVLLLAAEVRRLRGLRDHTDQPWRRSGVARGPGETSEDAVLLLVSQIARELVLDRDRALMEVERALERLLPPEYSVRVRVRHESASADGWAAWDSGMDSGRCLACLQDFSRDGHAFGCPRS